MNLGGQSPHVNYQKEIKSANVMYSMGQILNILHNNSSDST